MSEIIAGELRSHDRNDIMLSELFCIIERLYDFIH